MTEPNNETKMAEPNFDLLDEISVDFDDIEASVAKYKAGFGKVLDKNRYYFGMGKSVLRVLPWWNSVPRKWSLDRKVDVHKANGKEHVCMRALDGTECLFCSWFFTAGKDRYKNPKFKMFCIENGIRAGYAAAINLQIVEDCGDKGEGRFSRPEYKKWDVKYAVCGYGMHGSFLNILGNIHYKDATSPTRGRDLLMDRCMDKQTNRPATALTPHPDRRRIEDGGSQSAKEILSQCTDFSLWWPKIEGDELLEVRTYLASIEEKFEKHMSGEGSSYSGGSSAEGAKAEAKVEQDKETPAISATEMVGEYKGTTIEGDDGKSSEDEETFPGAKGRVKAVSEAKSEGATKSLGVIPTKEKGADGSRKCLNMGSKDTSNMECMLCESEMSCDT